MQSSIPIQEGPPAIARSAPLRKLRLLPLIAATYFMVAGGPYGMEDIIGKAGFLRALILLALVPFVWSLPTSLMVGELASAIPCEGGFYVWVRRALGPFWGFQEAWLSLAASVFDMAIYPVIFVSYLARLAPAWTAGHRGMLWELGVVFGCAAWNLRGARTVGVSSIFLFCVLLVPFVLLIGVCWLSKDPHGTGTLFSPIARPDIAGAIAVTLWNYMGWDNASTVAQEVEDPQRNYPRAMVMAAALVAATYILPLLAVGLANVDPQQFTTGAWVDAARTLCGSSGLGDVLALGIVLGGTINGVGMFNSLMLSYTRLPLAMAEDKLAPQVFTRTNRFGVPWVAVIFCACIWALALSFSFERLISIDLVLYGASLILEFIALVVLRVREPGLHRPFRVPGGMAGACVAGAGPLLLIAYAMYAARDEQVLGMNALLFALFVAAAGGLVYALVRKTQRTAPPATPSVST